MPAGSKPAGFQSGKTEKEGVNAKGQRVNVKTTKTSWADMAKAARAGIDTSIRGL